MDPFESVAGEVLVISVHGLYLLDDLWVSLAGRNGAHLDTSLQVHGAELVLKL